MHFLFKQIVVNLGIRVLLRSKWLIIVIANSRTREHLDAGNPATLSILVDDGCFVLSQESY